MTQRLTLLLALFILPLYLLAGETSRTEKKLDALLVYGKGFVFSVNEPSGWVGDIEGAKKYSANIIFYPAGKIHDPTQAVIRVLVIDKVDENTQEDLTHDMNGYKARYSGVKFKDISVSHPTYRIFPKLFTVPGQFYEYVAYVNPVPGKKQMFSVSMNKQKSEATTRELSAYQEIIASLRLL